MQKEKKPQILTYKEKDQTNVFESEGSESQGGKLNDFE